ncbi:nuclear transport factor 2 family protein [Algoriphagus boritolerans]|uniref:DUF4440 domain-containing protein n=1 Tax=Algoriphagus boritolerans DSM 17298 = JCM 18970 TaxID=1120964 RepID=A0A1H5RYM6_9BACT|nr:nuclear transport factor 2 family protein [Algoriphagus boritolerans]SEF42707.1 protein of unknown function [Algoriphagus boritolerans DSM 17298 = JCM 18970]
MKKQLFLFALILLNVGFTFAQSSPEREIKKLSLEKWQWMADKDIAKLTPLFHPQAKFVHMSGTWTTARELEIIETGSIWYKKADIKDTAIEIVGNTAIVWNRITLTANVRGSDVVTEFTVTEVYQKEGSVWKMLALTFSSVRDTHEIEK